MEKLVKKRSLNHEEMTGLAVDNPNEHDPA